VPTKTRTRRRLPLSEESDGTQGWQGLWVVDREHSRAEFAVRYLVSETTGVFGEVSGRMNFDERNPESSSVEAAIEVSSIDTGSRKRDEDLLEREEFLEAESFPEMTFQSTRVEMSGGDHMKVYGELTVRDVAREVVLDVQYKGQSTVGLAEHRAVFEAETELSRKEFGVDWGGTSGRAVIGDAVSVKLYLEAVKEGDRAE
jgi:polyisoprenoid-binding protein YceI